MDATLWLIGRALVGGLFLFAGVRHFFIAEPLTELIAARGVPAPRAVLYVGSAFEALCGLLVLTGILLVPAACGLIVFALAASVMLLNFWDMAPGPVREAAFNAWPTNIAIIGALLLLIVAA